MKEMIVRAVEQKSKKQIKLEVKVLAIIFDLITKDKIAKVCNQKKRELQSYFPIIVSNSMQTNSPIKLMGKQFSTHIGNNRSLISSQHVGANRSTYIPQSYVFPSRKPFQYTPNYQAHPIISNPQHQLQSQKIYDSQIANNRSFQKRQNKIYDQNPPVILNQTYSGSFDTRRVSLGLGLPQLPRLIMSNQSIKKTNVSTYKNENQCTFCRVIPWILSLLLILALIALLIYFFIFKHYHVKQQTAYPCSKPLCGVHKSIESEANQVMPQQYRGQQIQAQGNYLQDQTRPMAESIIGPFNRFYEEDHSNYRYLHLRRESKSTAN